MKQAIITKYLGPTNFRGSRIKAKCYGGSVTVSYRCELNTDQNHLEAAKALQAKMGWTNKLIGGSLDNGYVFIQE